MAIKYKLNRDLLDKRIAKMYGNNNNLAKALGITKQALSYKLNAEYVSIYSLIEISNALKISKSDFSDYFIEKVD